MKTTVEKFTAFWGRWGIIATLICAALSFFGGGIYTKWVAIDTHNEYLKQLLNSAISEIEYNSQISWYNNDKYIDKSLYFSFIRTDALWELYYNSNQIFAKNRAVTNELKECLDEMEGINRMAYAQYGEIVLILRIATDDEITSSSDENIKKLLTELEPKIMKDLHQKMYDKYNSNVIFLMAKVKTYLIDKQKEI